MLWPHQVFRSLGLYKMIMPSWLCWLKIGFLVEGWKYVYPGGGSSIWSRARINHLLRRSSRPDPLTKSSLLRQGGLQPHPAGGERSRPTSQPRFRWRNKIYVICYVRFVIYSGSLGKESSWLGLPLGGSVVVSYAYINPMEVIIESINQ